MKPTPTPEQIEAAERAIDALDYATMPVGDIHREIARAALSAALSVPAAAVVGEPVAWTTQAQIDKFKVDPGCNAVMWGEPLPHHPDIPLYAAPSAPDGWQPIETAPKDKTPVIVAVLDKDCDGFSVGEAYFDPEHYEDGDWWWAGTRADDWGSGPISDVNYHNPSLWRPLPAPPALGGASHE